MNLAHLSSRKFLIAALAILCITSLGLIHGQDVAGAIGLVAASFMGAHFAQDWKKA